MDYLVIVEDPREELGSPDGAEISDVELTLQQLVDYDIDDRAINVTIVGLNPDRIAMDKRFVIYSGDAVRRE